MDLTQARGGIVEDAPPAGISQHPFVAADFSDRPWAEHKGRLTRPSLHRQIAPKERREREIEQLRGAFGFARLEPAR
jgi:hypothetical protein